MQDLIRTLPGVEIDKGRLYRRSRTTHPTYRNHPGHAEAVEITYDPTKTDYRTLLEFFFQMHDPTTKNRQGNDFGSQLPLGDLLSRRRSEAHRMRHHHRCRAHRGCGPPRWSRR